MLNITNISIEDKGFLYEGEYHVFIKLNDTIAEFYNIKNKNDFIISEQYYVFSNKTEYFLLNHKKIDEDADYIPPEVTEDLKCPYLDILVKSKYIEYISNL